MSPTTINRLRYLLTKSAAISLLLCLPAFGPMAAGENHVSETGPPQDDLKELLRQVDAAYAKLQPQTIMSAEGYLKHDYLIPAGFYKQMWDWDGFFIGNHLMNQSSENAKYLKWWVLNFVDSVDANGYVSGCITTQRLAH